MVDVKTHMCFPTNIHEIKMNINKNDIKNMTSYMSVKSINGKFSNGAEDDLHTISTFKSLADGIVNCSKIILEKFEYQFEDVEITSMWGNVLNRGNAHPPHTHSNNILSGVFYLKTSPQTTPIQFFDPRPQASVLKPRKSADNNINSNISEFYSQTGLGVMFPAWLQHWVPETLDERISIAWNVLVRGEHGEPHTLQNAII